MTSLNVVVSLRPFQITRDFLNSRVLNCINLHDFVFTVNEDWKRRRSAVL